MALTALATRLSGKERVSLLPPPLRTGRATFTAPGSSKSHVRVDAPFRVYPLVAIQVYQYHIVPTVSGTPTTKVVFVDFLIIEDEVTTQRTHMLLTFCQPLFALWQGIRQMFLFSFLPLVPVVLFVRIIGGGVALN